MKIHFPDGLLRNRMVLLHLGSKKSDGLTTLGLQKLSETVRNYVYLISLSLTSMRGPIVVHEARNLDAQRVFLNTFENIINRRVDIPEGI